jgi:L-erythrulose 1-phosphate isomerase
MSPNRTILFGAGWKMNKTVSEAVEYVERLRELLTRIPGTEDAQIFLIPPFTALDAVKKASPEEWWVGAQNMHWEDCGAYTGEISAPMLCELGMDLVQLGHSERRQFFGEDDIQVRCKVRSALRHHLRPLICVGESAEEKEFGAQKETVVRQLRIPLESLEPSQAANLIIAYEPVWAIGKNGSILRPDYVSVMSGHIRSVLASILGTEAAFQARIIYGGSVDECNAPQILLQGNVDGLFIGRAALQAENFARLIEVCLKAAAMQASCE